MKIGVVGAVFIDIMGRPDGPFDPAGRNTGSVEFIPGGVGHNIARNLRRYGSDVAFLSSVDNSALGDSVIDSLKAGGTDVSYIARTPAGMGYWLAVTGSDAEIAASVSSQPDYRALENVVNDRGGQFVEECDVIALECDITADVLKSVTRLCRELNKPLYGAVSNLGILMNDLSCLSGMSGFVCNSIEAGRIIGRDLKGLNNDKILSVLEGSQDIFRSTVTVITTGKNGGVWMDRQASRSGTFESAAASVKDVTGAGDSFFSGFVYEKNKSGSTLEAIGFALASAAETLAFSGPVVL